jgi:transposase-like protein
MGDIERFCCQNPDCPDHGLRSRGNLSVCMRYGPEPQRRLLYCRTCKARFSERKGTPLFDARLPKGKLLAALAHIADGCGARQTARLVGVSKDAVTRLARLAGKHARQLHDELVAFSPSDRAGAARREVAPRREEAEALRTR